MVFAWGVPGLAILWIMIVYWVILIAFLALCFVVIGRMKGNEPDETSAPHD